MKTVIGLGNPGKKYELTRHNIGWLVLDMFAQKYPLNYEPGKGDYYFARGRLEKEDFVLVKPTTYMNHSGVAVVDVQEHFDLTNKDILIVVDEMQFEVGKMKIKTTGGDGGHNGLASIIYHLQSKDFPRLRCGIGRQNENNNLVAHVLSTFDREEHQKVSQMLTNAARAVKIWIEEKDILVAMNKINTLGKTTQDNQNEEQIEKNG